MSSELRHTGTARRTEEWRELFFLAGVCSIAFVVLLIVALVIDFMAPPPVHGGESTLVFIAENKTLYIAEQVLWILPNALAVLVYIALFIVMKDVNRSQSLIAATLGCLAWGTLLAVPVTSRGSVSLVYLSDKFMSAASADRQRYAVAAEAIIAENNTPAIVGILSAAGILLMSSVLLQESSWRFAGWLGVVTGALGVVSEALRHSAPWFYWGYGVLLWIWFLTIGVRLIRTGLRRDLESDPQDAR